MSAKLLRRIATLERALQPFADEAATWHERIGDRYRPGVTEPRKRTFYARAEFTIGDCRRAARLLRQALEQSARESKQ